MKSGRAWGGVTYPVWPVAGVGGSEGYERGQLVTQGHCISQSLAVPILHLLPATTSS